MRLDRLEATLKPKIPLSARQAVRRSLPRRRLHLEWKLASEVHVVITDQSDWTIYNDIFVDGEYDVAITDTLDEKVDGRTLNILDLGANVGFFSLRVVDQVRRLGRTETQLQLTLVEGNPRTSPMLSAAMARNGLLSDDVRIVHGLVGKRSGTGRITRHWMSGMSTVHGGSRLFTERVPFVDVEEVLPPGDVDLMKCDIEGSEQLFLEEYPGLLRRTRRAVFEFHPRLCDVGQCVDLLRAAGFVRSETIRSTPLFEVKYFSRVPGSGRSAN